MEFVRQLEESEYDSCRRMLPAWLHENIMENDEMELWGIKDFGTICGVAVISREADFVRLCHIYVEEKYRGSGRGGRLLFELIYNAHIYGASQFIVKYIPGRYPGLQNLLRNYPMMISEETVGSVSCTLENLLTSKALVGEYKNIKSLAECPQTELSAFYREIVDKGLDWVEMPIDKKDYLADFCAVKTEGGKPTGLLLIKEQKDGISIPLMVNVSDSVTAPIEMMRYALQKIVKTYPTNTSVHFEVVNESLLMLFERLGVSVERRCCASLDLSYFAESERTVDAYLDYLNEINKRIP